MQKALALGSGLVSRRTPDEQVVVEHIPQPLQRATHGWLAEEQACRGARYIPFLRKNGKDDQQIEIRLAQLRYAHRLARAILHSDGRT